MILPRVHTMFKRLFRLGIPTYCGWHPSLWGMEYRISGPVAEDKDMVSHGICKRCLKVWKRTWPKEGK